MSVWQDPDDVPHCWILFHDKTEWQLISATLCGWRRCFMADQLWFMTRIREGVNYRYTVVQLGQNAASYIGITSGIYCHVILGQLLWKYDVIIDFSRWRPQPLNTTSGFVFVDVLAFSRSQSINKPNFVRYLNWWLRYNYFHFWKTNVHHIGILLYYSASAYRISSKSEHPLRKYDVISISQYGGHNH